MKKNWAIAFCKISKFPFFRSPVSGKRPLLFCSILSGIQNELPKVATFQGREQ